MKIWLGFSYSDGSLKEKPASVLPLWQAGCLANRIWHEVQAHLLSKCSQRAKAADPSKKWHPKSQAGLPIGNLVIWKSHVKMGLKIQEHSSEIRKPKSRVWHRESWCSGFYGMLKTLLVEKRIPRLPEPNFVAGSMLVWRLLWRCGKVPCHWLTLSRAGTWKSRRGRGGF